MLFSGQTVAGFLVLCLMQTFRISLAGKGHDYHHQVSPLPAICRSHWAYKGECGEVAWGAVATLCVTGKDQSPVDINPRKTIYQELSSPRFYKGKGTKEHYMVNNAHTAIVQIDKEYFVESAGLPGKYKVAQIHFHWGSDDFKGSEHTINGESYPLEVHIVTYNRDKYPNLKTSIESSEHTAVAVFASFAQISDTNEGVEEFNAVAAALKEVKYADMKKKVDVVAFAPSKFLPHAPKSLAEYYRYLGSFTTPPCSQIVMWTVFKDTIPISHEQLTMFRTLSDKHTDERYEQMANNFRHVQPLGNRTIYRSFKTVPPEAKYRYVGSGVGGTTPSVTTIGLLYGVILSKMFLH